MRFFPGIDAPEHGTSFPLPYQARSTAPRAGLSSWNSSNPYLALAKKSDYFRSVVYGIVQGILERLYIFPQYQGYYIDGVNQDYLNYNNLYDGIDSGNEMTLKTEFVGDWYLALESVPLSIKLFAIREEIGDELSIRHLKNPLHELAGFISSAFRFIAYDYDPGLGLKEDFPQVGFSTAGYTPSSYVVPLEGGTDMANYLAFFASNVCIKDPGRVQSAASYKTNPQSPFEGVLSTFDAEDIKWSWKIGSDGSYPVISLTNFVKKLPISFGDVDFICMGGESRESDKLSYAAAETVIPALSGGFAAEIDTPNGPLRYKVFGDAWIMISKDPGGVGPSGYDKTIERLLGNRSLTPDFMTPFYKMNPWTLHLLDAAILGPMQNRMVLVNESYEIRHVNASYSRVVKATSLYDAEHGGLNDNDNMLGRIISSELSGSAGPTPMVMGVEISSRDGYFEDEQIEYDKVLFNCEESHYAGDKSSGRITVGFNGPINLKVSGGWDSAPTRYYGSRRATRTVGGTVVHGREYILSVFDLIGSDIIAHTYDRHDDAFTIYENTFTEPTISTEATHISRLLFPKGGYWKEGDWRTVFEPVSSTVRDVDFNCFSATARNSIIRKIVPMITVQMYGQALAYGGDRIEVESGAVVTDGSVDPSARPKEIRRPKATITEHGWFDNEFDKFHGNLHDKFCKIMNKLLFDDIFLTEQADVFDAAMSALATEHYQRPTLKDIAENTEDFMKRRMDDLMSYSLLKDCLTEQVTYEEAALIFIPDSKIGFEDISSIRFHPGVFDLAEGFEVDITLSRWMQAIGKGFATGGSEPFYRVTLSIGDTSNDGEQLSFGWKYRSGGSADTTLDIGSRAWVIGNMEVHGRESSTPWPAINA